jgi:heptosyltransferase-3
VDVVCLPHSEAIFKMNKRVRHIFVIPRDQFGFKKIYAYINLIRQLFTERYDLLAHFSIDWRGAFLARLLNVKISVSRNTHRRGYLWHQSFDFLAPALDTLRPMAEQDVDLLRVANLYKKKTAPAYNLNILPAQKTQLRNWLDKKNIKLTDKLVVIHPCSRLKYKEMPITVWSQIADTLKLQHINIVITGSQVDLEKNQLIYDYCKLKPVLTENFSLQDTATLYSLANLVLTIDSMSTHLASALKTPVISIFGPTNDKVWGPWKGKSEVIGLSGQDAPMFTCRPCGMDGCEGSNISQCLVQMDPQKVVHHALAMLNVSKKESFA